MKVGRFHDCFPFITLTHYHSVSVTMGVLSSQPSPAKAAVCVASIILSVMVPVETACQSCLLAVPVPFVARRHHTPHSHGAPANKGQASLAFGAFATRQLLSVLDNRHRRYSESSDDAEAGQVNDDDDSAAEGQSEKRGDGEVMTAAMVASIGFYKKVISPLLPPACRFLPTCSQYGVQAIEQFGPTKGAILTAWRLLRCSPIGGRGYDPPKWPPVAYNYGSY